MTGKWSVGLTCGHTLGDLTAAECDQARTAEVLPCVQCQASSTPDGTVKRGGLSRVKSLKRLEHAQNHEPPNLRFRPDGLIVRHFPGMERKMWWCKLCHGKRAKKWAVMEADTLGDVFTAWDIHKVSENHQILVKRKAAMDVLFDAIADSESDHP